ncbi:hypothetical protein ACJMK2_005494 [Sinanodonta woodiana]|uniref:3'-5' exoribonuclease 1 n=1 Tax=Sinanodonta woodiana TaxID=1069815 RepID=A0ABD3VQK6_SINWO
MEPQNVQNYLLKECQSVEQVRQTKSDESTDVRSKSVKPKVLKDGDYSDPVYKKLSRINGEINRMNKDEIKHKLADLKLDTRGVKDILKKRLKNYYKRKKLAIAKVQPDKRTKYDYLAFIDFEATCEENNINYQHEIIEFPIVLLDVQQNKIVDQFHEYVHPTKKPRLSHFCTTLTGIQQETVDKADPFPVVMDKVTKWMKKFKLGEGKKFAVVTDGPWDMQRFLFPQCQLSGVIFPKWAKRWINLRKIYSNFYECRRCGISGMLENLGMSFKGNPHCGLDDATNIALIAQHMLEDGCVFQYNEFLIIKPQPVGSEPQTEVENKKPEDTGTDSDEGQEFGGGDVCHESKGPELGTLDAELASSMNVLHLNSQDSSVENVSDLLEYYKLQSS